MSSFSEESNDGETSSFSTICVEDDSSNSKYGCAESDIPDGGNKRSESVNNISSILSPKILNFKYYFPFFGVGLLLFMIFIVVVYVVLFNNPFTETRISHTTLEGISEEEVKYSITRLKFEARIGDEVSLGQPVPQPFVNFFSKSLDDTYAVGVVPEVFSIVSEVYCCLQDALKSDDPNVRGLDPGDCYIVLKEVKSHHWTETESEAIQEAYEDFENTREDHQKFCQDREVVEMKLVSIERADALFNCQGFCKQPTLEYFLSYQTKESFQKMKRELKTILMERIREVEHVTEEVVTDEFVEDQLFEVINTVSGKCDAAGIESKTQEGNRFDFETAINEFGKGPLTFFCEDLTLNIVQFESAYPGLCEADLNTINCQIQTGYISHVDV